MIHIVKSVLMGIALAYPGVTLDNLREPHFFYVRHEYVTIQVWGRLDQSVHSVDWEMSKRNLREFEMAKEKQIKTPLPYGTT